MAFLEVKGLVHLKTLVSMMVHHSDADDDDDDPVVNQVVVISVKFLSADWASPFDAATSHQSVRHCRCF